MNKTIALAAALLFAAANVAAKDAATLNDAQIAQILVTANQMDIDGGNLAKSRGASKDVKAFAQQMITDHTASNKSASELMKKIKIRPEHSPTSKTLKQGGAEHMKTLKGLGGAEFDKAYMDHEVKMHEDVLGMIDNTLLPNAGNAELKEMLTNTRPVIAAHLDAAKSVRETLGKP